MFRGVSQQSTIPSLRPDLHGQRANRVPAQVHGNGAWREAKRVAGIVEASAQVNVLEPNGVERLVQSTNSLQGFSAQQQKCPRRLLHLAFAAEVHVQQAVPPVDRIASPHSVETERLEDQCRRCGQRSDRKADLSRPVGIHQQSAGARNTLAATSRDKSIQACQQLAVGIEQQHKGSVRRGDTLVDRGREAAIDGIVDP